MSFKNINPDISEIKTGTPAIKIGDKYVVGGIGGNFIPQVEIKDKEVILGQVNADGNFQPLSFSGQEASNSGSPETVENYYGFNGVLPVPNSNSNSCDYYKCASVDTINNTWTGYKAVLSDGVYTFEENITAGLTYGTGFTPEVKSIYDATASVAISGLWSGSLIPSDYIFCAPLDNTGSLTNSGVTFTLDSTLNRNVAVFSGSSYLSAQSSELDSVFTGGDFTLSCWLYQTGTSGIPYFYSNSSQIGFGYPASMSQFRIHKQGYDHNCNTSDISDRWVSFTLTYSEGIAQAYIDGSLNGEIDIDFDLGLNESTHYFGSWQDGEQPLPEGSKLCNLRVYDRVLSAKEIGLIASEISQLASEFTPNA